MILLDVNVLVYACRKAEPEHALIRKWLEGILSGDAPFGVSDLVLSGFLRVMTHPSIFKPAETVEEALRFAEAVRNAPNAVAVAPGPRHWEIFARLCRVGRARGNLIPDAYLAALAIESGCEWVTVDRDYGRFPGLRWRHPLER